MTEKSLQQTREELARREVGHTTIGRGTAWLLVGQFILLVGGALLAEIVHDGSDSLRRRAASLVRVTVSPLRSEADASLPTRVFRKNRVVIGELERFDDDAGEQTLLGQMLRPGTQYFLSAFGAGNEQAYIGGKAWLFFRDSLDYLIGPSFLESRNPRPAILDLQAQLERRGIRLIVIPTPVKPSVHPERFSRGFEEVGGPLRPADYESLISQLGERGVLVFDPAPFLFDAKRQTGTPQYLMTDTHWRPEAMELVAAHLRDFVSQHVELPPAPGADYTSENVEVTNRGDVARMLDLPEGQSRYPKELVRVRRIRIEEGAPWESSRKADVLLLGDSFSNIYSLAEMGWGESGGFAEQLSFLMQRPIDRIVQNADGAFAAREHLGRELAGGRDRLAGKRLVIFQFAERELAVGDWTLVDLSLGEAAPGQFFVPAPGEAVAVSGTIQEIAPIPRPGTVPYADHITAIHLVDLAGDGAGVSGAQAVVYIWGMRDRVLQEASQFRAGDRISVRLRPWADVANQYDGISRTELANENVQFEVPTWGEVAP